jgi:iron complex outermembrane receptor protein
VRGTESTLLGKNASVGAISIVSRTPGTEPGGELRGAVDLVRGGGSADAAADLPLAPGSGLRIAAHYNATEGWVRNTATGRDVPIDHDGGLRLTGVLHPGGALTATLSYQHGTDLRIGVPYQIVDPNLPASFGEGAFNDQESEYTALTKRHETTHQTTSNLASVKLEWPLGPFSAVSQTGLVEYRLKFDDDFDFSNQPWTDFIRAETYTQASQELRLLSPAGQPVEYLVGAFLFASQWHSVEQQLWGVPGFPPGTPIAGQLFNGPFVNDFRQNTANEALFAELAWQASSRWRLSAGLRLSHERKDVLYGRANAAPLTIWNTVANPPFAATPLAFADSFLDGNASIQWQLAPRATLYASYAHGTKAGGFAETNTVPSADPARDARIGSERTQTVELGIKSTSADGTLRLNASLFDMHVANFQDTTFTGTAFITENLPLRSRGVDLEASWQAAPGLRASAAVTYSSALETATALDAQNGLTCNPCTATEAPLWNGSAQVAYRHTLSAALDWGLSAHVRYRSEMYHQRGERYLASSFMPIDAGIEVTARSQRYGATLLGKNITNRYTEDFSSPSVAPYFAGLASPAPLRTITLGAWSRF